METMGLVAILLTAIIVLLCNKREDRGKVLLLIGGFLLVYRFGLLLLAIGWESFKSPKFYEVLACIVAAILIPQRIVAGVRMWRRDVALDGAIREGSEEAFNERVEGFKQTLNMSHDRAVRIVTRIRDGNTPKIPPNTESQY